MRALLQLLPRRVRWLVTVDAMHTQTATATLICATLKSHYLMIVKSNQPKLLTRITALPWADVPVVATDDTRGHGRVEQRTLQILTAARGIGFPYAKQVIRITRERLVNATGQSSVEVVHAVCSLPFEQARPATIAGWPRQHWGIENRVHWVRDVTFDEDRHHAHTGNSAQILATVRNTAISCSAWPEPTTSPRPAAPPHSPPTAASTSSTPKSPAHKPANQQRRSPGLRSRMTTAPKSDATPRM